MDEGSNGDANMPTTVRSADSSDARRDDSTTHADPEKGIDSGDDSKATESAPTADAADPNIVWWDGDDDPANPMNWKASKKWGNIAVLSFNTFLTPLGSSFFAPGVPELMRDFHSTSDELATFVVSVYVLGFGIGPLVIAPLSEMYGRLPLYTICSCAFVVFSVACAVSSSMGMLITFRFLQGCFGSAPVTIGGGTIADLFPPEARGAAMSLWAIGPLFGPVVGPIAGGFLVDATNWRWVFWVLVIVGGVAAIASIVFLRESYAPVILERKAERLRKETGNTQIRSKLDSGITHKELLKRSIVRPTKMMVFSPIIALLTLYFSVVYGILYLLFSTFTFVYEDTYHFSPAIVGLSFLGIGIGNLVGLFLLGTISDRIIKGAQARGEEVKPELRMPIAITVPAGACIPLGLFIYGWTAEYEVHWFVPIFGTSFTGFGMIALFMCIQTYLVDAFTIHAASAIAANTVVRSIVGALLPLAGLRMYNTLGLGWGNSLIAFLALALVPLPAVFNKYGERIRTSKRFQVEF